MNKEMLEMLARLGLIEVLQSYLEGDEYYDSYYWREDEKVDDEFFKKDLDEE